MLSDACRVARLAAVFVASASALVGRVISLAVFGALHYALDRYLLDDKDVSVRSSLGTAALWAAFFGLLVWWSQRRGSRRQRSCSEALPEGDTTA